MTTITAQSKSKNPKKGFSLVEVIITMGLLTMIIAVGLSAVTFISQSSTALTNYTIMSTNGRQALEILSRDLRMGYDINSASPKTFDFQIYGKAGANDRIAYEYDEVADILYRTVNAGTKEVVMDDLVSFAFNYYNLRRLPTTAEISIKEVQIEGLLKRSSLRINNTNHIISARFMLRNRSVSN
jgi:prepilin-type N-terminal cleavage/methylation domain-containing protein